MKYALATLAVLASTACAQAATVTETAVGGFSGIATTPTVISAGTTVIQGSGAADAYDIFQINGLAPGAQPLTLDFTGPTGVGPSFAAGGSVLSKTSPLLPLACSVMRPRIN